MTTSSHVVLFWFLILMILDQKMTSTIVLGVYWGEDDIRSIELENVDLNSKVIEVKKRASEDLNCSADDLDIHYVGEVLQDEDTLSSYGIASGKTLQVLKKSPSYPVKDPMTETEITRLIKKFAEYSEKKILQKIPHSGLLEKILSSVPDLYNDPPAIAILRDPDLLATFGTESTLHPILDIHPTLAYALSEIVKEITKNPNVVYSNQASTSAQSYSLDAISDDDETPELQNGTHQPQANRLSQSSTYNAITAAQLAAAIADATSYFSNSAQNEDQDMPSVSSQEPRITNDMLSNALQQTWGGSFHQNTNHITPPRPPVNFITTDDAESLETLRVRLSPQLAHMLEMGLSNETQNIRALQATNGDLQAAVELVFNGTIEMEF